MASPVNHLVRGPSTIKAEVTKVGITAVYFDIIIIIVSYVIALNSLFIHYLLQYHMYRYLHGHKITTLGILLCLDHNVSWTSFMSKAPQSLLLLSSSSSKLDFAHH